VSPAKDVVDGYGWRMMYLGAFAALRIQNLEIAGELTANTTSDEEAAHVIELLRTGKEGDRVYPALAWLKARRAGRKAAP
jgi:hypothetical protein